MKLIKKAAKKINKPNAADIFDLLKEINKPRVGDIVRIKFFYFDGRVTECTIDKVTVVKVNRVTFDFEKDNGDIYRMDINSPDVILNDNY
jgi:hypothetical protein